MKSVRSHSLWTDLGHPHFITAVTKDRLKIFSDDVCAKFLIDEWKFYSDLYNVELLAGIVMPDHFHIIIWSKGERTFSDFMHGVKGHFAKWYGEELVKRGMGAPPMGRTTERIGGRSIDSGTLENHRRGSHAPLIERNVFTPKIWQDSFFDYVIPTDEKLNEKIEYILHNPIEDNLVANWCDYPYIFLSDKYIV
ncbi:MAG: transposase [Patescibacteria group bacterium]|jgi:REP element-mobilizing transposase RayT